MNQMVPAMSPPRMTPQMMQALMATRAGGGSMPHGGSSAQQAAPTMPPSPGLPLQSLPRPTIPLTTSHPPQMPPGLAQFARVAQAPMGGMQDQPPRQPRLSPQELGQLGRGGDALVAHLTPGEIAVPPQVQTPQVLAAIRHAFGQVGASPAQFTAGSPASSINPRTGMPEYDIWSSILPAIAGVGGALLAPELLPLDAAAWMAPAASAAGSALGTGLGAVATGSTPTQALYAGLGAGAGSYVGGGGLGNLFGDSTAAGESAAASQAATAATNTSPLGGFTDNTPWTDTTVGQPASSGTLGGADAASQFQPGLSASSSATDGLGQSQPAALSGKSDPFATESTGYKMPQNYTLGVPTYAAPKGALIGSGLGALAGSALAPASSSSTNPNLPAGFTTPKPPTNPAFNQLLGNNQSQTPTFAGYNPYAAVSGQAYNWYAPSGTSPISTTPGPNVDTAAPAYAAYPFPQPVIG